MRKYYDYVVKSIENVIHAVLYYNKWLRMLNQSINVESCISILKL